MAKTIFGRTLSGRIVARLEERETEFLKVLLAQSIELIEPEDASDRDPLAVLVGIDPDARKPEDPALARLLPDAYKDDHEAAAQFRRFNERSLRERKVANATTMLTSLGRSGGKLLLTKDEAQAWLGAINDVRLVMGTRLGVTATGDLRDLFDLAETEVDEAPVDDVPAESDSLTESLELHGAIYDWLTYLQEDLVTVVMRSH